MTTHAGQRAPSPSFTGVTAPVRAPERHVPPTAARIASLGSSPTLDDCLTAYGLDLHHVEADQARRAVAHWLRSWAGFGMDADDLAEQVAA